MATSRIMGGSMGKTVEGSVEFGMRERFDPDGSLRLALRGELDLSVVQALADRLNQLRNEGYFVRVDLSQLEFMDSSGLRTLALAASQARRDGGRLEVGRQLTEPVRRLIEIAGLGAQFWPHVE